MGNLLISKYEISTNGVDFKLKFYDRITLIGGDSGCGKTLLFKAIQEESLISQGSMFKCLDYRDTTDSESIDRVIKSKGKVIVIDNAGIILTNQNKLDIIKNTDSKYIIFTHDISGYNSNKNCLATLKVENNIGKLEYSMR